MTPESLTLRLLPYPYKAMMAICSDLDETPDGPAYFETMRFLNTEDQTSVGKGVGLEVGNTLYFKMPDGQFSYWNSTDADKIKLHQYFRSGHIDCIHSFGDLVYQREEVEEIWRLLAGKECHPEVWIDHAQAKSNFDPDIMLGEGAQPNSDCYHADISLAQGIKFVWKGRVTSIIGQDVAPSFDGLFNIFHPVQSGTTVLKEVAKNLIARVGSKKYSMNRKNSILRKTTLNSGQHIYEFLRSNPSWGGVSCFETADGIGNVLTSKMLDTLVKKSGTTILYTHLGKTRSDQCLPASAVTAFRLLADYVSNNTIMVTTTRRLLGFKRTLNELAWTDEKVGNALEIKVNTRFPAKDLEGLCWYLPDGSGEVSIHINGAVVQSQRNPADESGKTSISIPWTHLVFPK